MQCYWRNVWDRWGDLGRSWHPTSACGYWSGRRRVITLLCAPGESPPNYLRKYCLKGTGEQAGTILVDRKLRQQVQFRQINLNSALPQLGTFDFVFLRNVLLYFNLQTKREVVARVLSMLKPGGWLFISHTETLHDVSNAVEAVRPATYRKR